MQFDMAELRDYRKRETHGNAFRKPRVYGLLTSTDVGEPFIRVNTEAMMYDQAGR